MTPEKIKKLSKGRGVASPSPGLYIARALLKKALAALPSEHAWTIDPEARTLTATWPRGHLAPWTPDVLSHHFGSAMRSTQEILAEARNALQPVQILVDESGDADARDGLRRALALISEVYDQDVAVSWPGPVRARVARSYGEGALAHALLMLPYVSAVRCDPTPGVITIALRPGPQTHEEHIELLRTIERHRSIGVRARWTVDPSIPDPPVWDSRLGRYRCVIVPMPTEPLWVEGARREAERRARRS